MNYLELINKCLVELNYKQVNAFSELVKNDHKKLKNIINMLNSEICRSDRWNFLQRKTTVTIPANTGEVENTINGRIEAVIINGQKYDYYPDFERFFTNSQPQYTYSFYDDKILLPLFNIEKTAEILYYTNNYAKDELGQEKLIMENENDSSLIPTPLSEPLLVYGACMRLKGNPQHIRFSYWLSMYKDALANLRSRVSATVDEVPTVNIRRH